MRFGTPYFEMLRRQFRTDPGSAHLCPQGFHKGSPAPCDTSATRMAEALCIANGLVTNRAALVADDDDFVGILRNYGYKGDTCAHGIARGAKDLAHFLEEQWGHADVYEGLEEETAAARIGRSTGIVAFIGIDDEWGRGHIDLWNTDKVTGHAYWDCRKMLYWKLG